MTRNQSADNFNSHPEGAELHVRGDRMIVTKHICHKVVFRARATTGKNPVVNTNTARVFCVGCERAGEEVKKSKGQERRGTDGSLQSFSTSV